MENPKLGMIIFGASMLTNAFLNWVFIFGNLGAPALGVVGAAVATLSARVLEFVIMFSYALTNHRFRHSDAIHSSAHDAAGVAAALAAGEDAPQGALIALVPQNLHR